VNEFKLSLKQNKCECKVCQFIRRYTGIAESLQSPDDKEFMMNHLNNFINLEEELGMLQEYVKDLEGKIMNELQECHRLLWAFRKEIEPYWATPDPLNSLRYAFCEAAEAMDAWLRQSRPDDSRNNERENDVLDELADCAIMLLTAMGQNVSPHISFKSNSRGDIGFLGYKVAELLNSWFYSSTTEYIDTIAIISNYSGMELKQHIQGRLEKIVKKHVPLDKQKTICEKVGITCLLTEEIKELRKQHLANLGIVNEPPM